MKTNFSEKNEKKSFVEIKQSYKSSYITHITHILNDKIEGQKEEMWVSQSLSDFVVGDILILKIFIRQMRFTKEALLQAK